MYVFECALLRTPLSVRSQVQDDLYGRFKARYQCERPAGSCFNCEGLVVHRSGRGLQKVLSRVLPSSRGFCSVLKAPSAYLFQTLYLRDTTTSLKAYTGSASSTLTRRSGSRTRFALSISRSSFTCQSCHERRLQSS